MSWTCFTYIPSADLSPFAAWNRSCQNTSKRETNPQLSSPERGFSTSNSLFRISPPVCLCSKNSYFIFYGNIEDCKVRKVPHSPKINYVSHEEDTFYWMANNVLKVLSFMSNLVIKIERSQDICWFHI